MKKLIYILGILCIAYNLHAQYIPSPLTTGTNYEIDELFIDTTTNTLFVGGDFTIAGGESVESSAIWNGSSWEIPAFRAGGIANSYYKGELYTSGPGGAGYFEAGIPPIQCCFAPMMKRELGTNNWIPIGQEATNGWGGEMYDMEVEGDTMYLFGSFTKIGNTSVRHIAKFDGQNFYAIPPPDTSWGATIRCAKFYKGELYVAGNFHGTSDPSIWDIAKWNGYNWENLGSPLTGFMTAVGNMEVYDGKLIVSGGFFQSQGDIADGIMSWDGIQWQNLGAGLKWDIADLLEYEGDLYVAGRAWPLNTSSPFKGVARWDGSTWSSIGIDTIAGGLLDITQWNGDFYFGGGFTQINGVACKNIARYSLATGIFSPVTQQTMISLSPNPAHHYFTLSNPQKTRIDAVYLYNTAGQVVKSYENVGEVSSQTFDIRTLPTGLYHLQIHTLAGIHNHKLIIE